MQDGLKPAYIIGDNVIPDASSGFDSQDEKITIRREFKFCTNADIYNGGKIALFASHSDLPRGECWEDYAHMGDNDFTVFSKLFSDLLEGKLGVNSYYINFNFRPGLDTDNGPFWSTAQEKIIMLSMDHPALAGSMYCGGVVVCSWQQARLECAGFAPGVSQRL